MYFTYRFYMVNCHFLWAPLPINKLQMNRLKQAWKFCCHFRRDRLVSFTPCGKQDRASLEGQHFLFLQGQQNASHSFYRDIQNNNTLWLTALALSTNYSIVLIKVSGMLLALCSTRWGYSNDRHTNFSTPHAHYECTQYQNITLAAATGEQLMIHMKPAEHSYQ